MIGQLIIEVEGRRRTLSAGLKVYGTKEDLTQLRDAITEALDKGLEMGWVGAGEIDDPKSVFPFNAKDDTIKTKDWRSLND